MITAKENSSSYPGTEQGRKFGVRLIRSRLFRKYFILLATVILITTSISGTIMVTLVSSTYRAQKEEQIRETTDLLAKNAGALLTGTQGGTVTDYQNALEFICYTLKNYSDTLDAKVFIAGADGSILICNELLSSVSPFVSGGSCSKHSGLKIDSDTLDGILSGERRQWQGSELSVDDNLKYNISASPVYFTVNGENNLMGFIILSSDDTQTIQSYLRSLRMEFYISAAFAVVVAFIIIYFVIYRFAYPFREIVFATRQYAQGDFTYRIKDVRGNDEMSELISAFNSMANDLSAIENSRRNFVANVSHELKTPLTTIGGFVDGILDGTIKPSEQKKYLAIISDEVRRLARLISSMLNMSKIEAGELTPVFTRFSMSEMIIKTFLSFEQIISASGIDVEGLDGLQNVSVSADPDMINQVIYNIIDNAVKFTPRGFRIEVKCVREGPNAVVKIRNYGVSIHNEELRMVFDRFYKVDKSRSLNTKSVGLGLYICKSIIELHNGKIFATSEEGEYTEFTVELPVDQ